jgi:CheY-like chemotaxis protein
VPKTLLAVDDSATMRKVLEITFAGEDFRVVSADGAASALARLSDDPIAAVIDTSLGGGEDSYALAKEVRSRNGRVAVVLMASRYSPYDANRGRDAGVDDFVDKPFDTQVLIDKVKKALLARELARSAAAAAPPPPAPAPQTPAAPAYTPSAFGSPPRAPGPPAVAPAAAPRPGAYAQRTDTLSFEGSVGGKTPAAPAAPIAAMSRTASAGVPIAPPPPAPATPAAPAAPAPTALSHTVPAAPQRMEPTTINPTALAANGGFASKLEELGLTPQQFEAVVALSRELVERVAWEVVPQLAEALIKEEIARLTKES